MKNQKFTQYTFIFLSLCFGTTLFASQNELIRIKNLEGHWKFSIGERSEWVSSSYDDSQWETIQVPSSWEDQGFHGYNGFASYRKNFSLSKEQKGKTLYLNLGYIDDVDDISDISSI